MKVEWVRQNEVERWSHVYFELVGIAEFCGCTMTQGCSISSYPERAWQHRRAAAVRLPQWWPFETWGTPGRDTSLCRYTLCAETCPSSCLAKLNWQSIERRMACCSNLKLLEASAKNWGGSWHDVVAVNGTTAFYHMRVHVPTRDPRSSRAGRRVRHGPLTKLRTANELSGVHSNTPY